MTRTTDDESRALRLARTLLLLPVLGLFQCQSASDRGTGGETHFLTCSTDSDCDSAGFRCLDGRCRRDPSFPLDTGIVDVPDAGGPSCSTGVVPAEEVVIVGDSFFGTTHEITAQLESLARDAGVQSSEDHYRDYSRLVGNALALPNNGIGAQYETALGEGAISVVIMNGGGADALLGSCETVEPACPMISDAADAAGALLARMAEDGVKDVVYVFYPDPMDEPTRAKIDVLRPLIQSACEEAPLRCTWVDLRPSFEGNYEQYIADDGLNPTSAGSEAAAKEIWGVMQSNCIAQ